MTKKEIEKKPKKERKTRSKDPKIVINITNNKEKKTNKRKRKVIHKSKHERTGIVHVNDRYNSHANTMFMGGSSIPISNKPEYQLTPYIPSQISASPIAPMPNIPAPLLIKNKKIPPIRQKLPRFKTNTPFDKLTLSELKAKAKDLGFNSSKLKTKSQYFDAFKMYMKSMSKPKHDDGHMAPVINEPNMPPTKSKAQNVLKEAIFHHEKANAKEWNEATHTSGGGGHFISSNDLPAKGAFEEQHITESTNLKKNH